MNNYTQADQQLHRLCQIIAKANRSFVPKREDDSHTNLGFNAGNMQIEGRWIETELGKIRLILRLIDVCFVWQDSDYVNIQTVSTAKKYINEIEQQLEKTLETRGLDRAAFREPLHFEIPDYAFKEQPVALMSRLALNEWIYWRTLANEACEYVMKKLDQDAEIRIWPHHFDTGIYMNITQAMGIGFGLAMKDGKADAPYFYASCYLQDGDINYEKADSLSYGFWIADDWKGAVLSLEDLEFRKSAFSLERVKVFVDEAVGWFIKVNQ